MIEEDIGSGGGGLNDYTYNLAFYLLSHQSRLIIRREEEDVYCVTSVTVFKWQLARVNDIR